MDETATLITPGEPAAAFRRARVRADGFPKIGALTGRRRIVGRVCMKRYKEKRREPLHARTYACSIETYACSIERYAAQVKLSLIVSSRTDQLQRSTNRSDSQRLRRQNGRMKTTDLTSDQAEKLLAEVTAMLGYLSRLSARMDKRGMGTEPTTHSLRPPRSRCQRSTPKGERCVRESSDPGALCAGLDMQLRKKGRRLSTKMRLDMMPRRPKSITVRAARWFR
jgi:hypothetical protein